MGLNIAKVLSIISMTPSCWNTIKILLPLRGRRWSHESRYFFIGKHNFHRRIIENRAGTLNHWSLSMIIRRDMRGTRNASLLSGLINISL